MAVNPVDPPIGETWHRPGPPRSAGPNRVIGGGLEISGNAVDDTVNGAVAVLQVSSALLRYSAEVAVRTSRSLPLPHLLSGPARGLRRALHGPVARVLAHPASTVLAAVAAAADELVPVATQAVLARLDVPALVREFVDLDRVAALLDVDAVVKRVDLDAILDRVDLDAVVARVDLDAILDRVDLDALVDKVDVSRVVDRVDLDAAVARVDLDAAVARVDLDAAVGRVDLDQAVDRVDVDRVIARTDIAGLARYIVQVIDLPGLLRASTGTVSSEMVRSVRDQGADADRAVERVVDRLLRRQGRRTETDRGTGVTGPEHRT